MEMDISRCWLTEAGLPSDREINQFISHDPSLGFTEERRSALYMSES